MELAVPLIVPFDRLGGVLIAGAVGDFAELLQLLRSDFIDDDVQNTQFNGEAGFKQLVVGEVAHRDLKPENSAQQREIDLPEPGAAPGPGLHQPEKLQPPQRFADTDTADTEQFRHLFFGGQFVVQCQFMVDNVGQNLVYYLLCLAGILGFHQIFPYFVIQI